VLFHPESMQGAGYAAQVEVRFSLFEQVAFGRVIDPDTVKWWQEPDQRDGALHLLSQPEVSVADGLRMLSRVISQATGRVWAQGASFDFPLLGDLYDSAGLPRPWPFWMERDTRTAYDMAELLGGFNRAAYDKTRKGIRHGAGSDCVHQIGAVRAAIDAMKNRGSGGPVKAPTEIMSLPVAAPGDGSDGASQ
jgi:hypothetical protein